MVKWEGKVYFDNGRTLQWGKDLTKEQIKALENGEMFMLLDEQNKPHSIVLKDSYNQTREMKLENSISQ